jgi:AcrR family transcriptional regulator
MVNRGRTATRRRVRTRLELDVRRAQLLELGRALFNERAYDDLSIDDIAAEAGISKGLLYHYFPSKRRFFVEVVRAAAARMLVLTEPPPKDRAPKERLLAGLDAYLAYVEGNARAYAWLLRSGIGIDAEVRDVLEDVRRAIVDRIVEGLGLTGAKTPPPIRIALRGWIGMVEAASLDWVEHRMDMRRDTLRDFVAACLEGAILAVVDPAAIEAATPFSAHETRR